MEYGVYSYIGKNLILHRSDSAMKLTFGKYRGRSLEDVPDDYLVWVLDHAESAGPTLKEAIRRHLGLDGTSNENGNGHGGGLLPAELQEALRSWHRRMALRFHPDRGGSNEQMQSIQEGYEELRRIFGL